jgi:RNA recognition motif-containing protein
LLCIKNWIRPVKAVTTHLMRCLVQARPRELNSALDFLVFNLEVVLMSIRLYVGNLPKEIERTELEELFSQASGELTSTKVVTDRKTGKCRGFGFVTVETEEQADAIIEKLNGYTLKESVLKIEKALPKAKETVASTVEPPTAAVKRTSAKGKSQGRQSQGASSSNGGQSESFQPDPRWAQDLEKLKEMLLAQTNA